MFKEKAYGAPLSIDPGSLNPQRLRSNGPTLNKRELSFLRGCIQASRQITNGYAKLPDVLPHDTAAALLDVFWTNDGTMAVVGIRYYALSYLRLHHDGGAR